MLDAGAEVYEGAAAHVRTVAEDAHLEDASHVAPVVRALEEASALRRGAGVVCPAGRREAAPPPRSLVP